jgi:hypothetical protein
MRAERAKLAAYKNGVCLLNNSHLEEAAKKDEINAFHAVKKATMIFEAKEKEQQEQHRKKVMEVSKLNFKTFYSP